MTTLTQLFANIQDRFATQTRKAPRRAATMRLSRLESLEERNLFSVSAGMLPAVLLDLDGGQGDPVAAEVACYQAGGHAAGGAVALEDVTTVKESDQSSPHLFQSSVDGEQVDDVELNSPEQESAAGQGYVNVGLVGNEDGYYADEFDAHGSSSFEEVKVTVTHVRDAYYPYELTNLLVDPLGDSATASGDQQEEGVREELDLDFGETSVTYCTPNEVTPDNGNGFEEIKVTVGDVRNDAIFVMIPGLTTDDGRGLELNEADLRNDAIFVQIPDLTADIGSSFEEPVTLEDVRNDAIYVMIPNVTADSSNGFEENTFTLADVSNNTAEIDFVEALKVTLADDDEQLSDWDFEDALDLIAADVTAHELSS